jgi:hypothetical protein
VARQIQSISSLVPKKIRKRLLWLLDDARSMGIHLQAGKGSGKSRLMGRVIAWLDFLRGVPTILFDPVGTSIDNFLDKMARLPRELQERLWPRVRYVDMSGQYGHVCPFPLYYRLGDESLYEISQRVLDTIRKIDPYLQTASVEGWNALWETGTYAGMLLYALGYQFTEMTQLLLNPLTWADRYDEMVDRYPELALVVTFFRQLSEAPGGTDRRRTGSLAVKAAMFSLDPTMKAMFGASTPGIDWGDLEQVRPINLFDFRHVRDPERRRFMMFWVYQYFVDYVRRRGPGRHLPISFIVDELPALFSIQAMATEDFAADVQVLINEVARNYGIWLCLAHQESFQNSELLQKSLMSMGTQILGKTSDQEAAIGLAGQFTRYNPHLVKKYERVWMSDMMGAYVVDHRSVEYTIDEQLLLQSYRFRDQGLFRFQVRPASGEGDVTGGLRPITIENFDRDIYPHEQLVAQAKELLMKRWPRVEDVRAEVEARRERPRLTSKRAKRKRPKRKRPKRPVPRSGLVDAD